MKARDLDLLTMLRLDPREGRIFLHQRRVLVVNADALGTLRKDLIAGLGLDRAKGFLIRYGWSCGYHDALDMRHRYPWEPEGEWLHAAPVLHSLEGVARVRVALSEVDREAGTFHAEGTWEHSYEAEQHTRHFGPAGEPVCWTLCGYAGGYGSAYLGRRVVYREVACVGRGDPVCRFVGRALEGWGPEIAPELPYYEETKIGEELDRAYREIQGQHQLLQRTAAIHEELTRLVLEGKHAGEITDSLSRLLARPVALEDAAHRLLCASPPAIFAAARASGRGPVGMAAAAGGLAGEIAALQGTLRPRRLDPVPAAGIRRPWLAAPISAGGRILGYIALLDTVAAELETMVLERAASVYALELLKQQAVAEAESRILGDLIASLLHGGFADEEVMARRMRYLSIDPEAQYQVAVVEIAGLGQLLADLEGSEPKLEAMKQQLAHQAREVLGKVAPGSAATIQGDQVALLVRLREDEPPTRRLSAIWEHLRAAAGCALRAGVGPLCRRPRDYAASFARAREMLAILRAFGKSDELWLHEDLGPYSALFRPEAQAELAAWAQRRLGPLLQYDQKRDAEWLRTLEAYLRADCSLSATARATNLHPSGLKYRLARIAELLEVDLTRTDMRFELHLALLVARLANLGP